MTLPAVHDQLEKPVSLSSTLSVVQASRLVLQTLLSGEVCGIDCRQALQQLSIRWLRQQGLAPLVWQRWRNTALAGLANELADLQRAYYTAIADSELLTHELQRVLAALHTAAVTPVVFKGAAFAYTTYPLPACRPMGDIDFWVPASNMAQAVRVLMDVGYATRLRLTRPMAMAQQNGGEIQLVRPVPGAGLVELHWGVFPGEWLQRAANVDERGVLRRCVGVTLADVPALTLSPEDSLIQAATHYAIGHQMSMPWYRTTPPRTEEAYSTPWQKPT